VAVSIQPDRTEQRFFCLQCLREFKVPFALVKRLLSSNLDVEVDRTLYSTIDTL
jgi:hypothetical protein